MLREKNGTNGQIEVFTDNPNFRSKYRKDPLVDICIGWNRKRATARVQK